MTDVKEYARLAWGLRGFLHQRITLEEAEAIVRRRIAERAENFLRVIERGIFGYPQSPYLPLLKLARCELGDIQNMVRANGLEDTLRALREAGVHVTFEEFKGREPIVRDGQVIPAEPRDFDNPYLGPHYYGGSSGTTGPSTRVAMVLDHLTATNPNVMLAFEAYGLLHVPTAVWLSILPNSSGVGTVLRLANLGQVPKKWFSPLVASDLRPSLKSRLATQYIVAMGRLLGIRIPGPEPLTLDRAGVLAHWMADTLKAYGVCLLMTQVSKALRICIAAQEEGLDLTGAAILAGGEPPTPAKVQTMTDVGARWLVGYWLTELGILGLGCLNPADLNDIHLFRDCVALIQYRREVSGSGITVDAFHFTSLLPTAPKLMLNVESDDYGLVETRSCGCPLDSFGFTEHVRHIRSFRKLSGEGVTLVGSEMLHILEEVLPARFGGSPLDYQLLEEEDEQGFTRLSLLISPKVNIDNEDEVILTVLEALGEGSVAADFARAIWSQAGTLRVKRMEPVWTAQGKLMPLHLARHPSKQRP
jgi:hypothetical protein